MKWNHCIRFVVIGMGWNEINGIQFVEPILFAIYDLIHSLKALIDCIPSALSPYVITIIIQCHSLPECSHSQSLCANKSPRNAKQSRRWFLLFVLNWNEMKWNGIKSLFVSLSLFILLIFLLFVLMLILSDWVCFEVVLFCSFIHWFPTKESERKREKEKEREREKGMHSVLGLLVLTQSVWCS